MIVIRWGSVLEDGTAVKDCEVLFASAEDAKEFHGQLLSSDKTTYISMETIDD